MKYPKQWVTIHNIDAISIGLRPRELALLDLHKTFYWREYDIQKKGPTNYVKLRCSPFENAISRNDDSRQTKERTLNQYSIVRVCDGASILMGNHTIQVSAHTTNLIAQNRREKNCNQFSIQNWIAIGPKGREDDERRRMTTYWARNLYMWIFCVATPEWWCGTFRMNFNTDIYVWRRLMHAQARALNFSPISHNRYIHLLTRTQWVWLTHI